MTTIRPQTNRNYATYIVYALTAVGIILLVFFGINIIKNFNKITGKSGLSAELFVGDAKVYLNDEFSGDTPYNNEDIKPGEHKVSVRNDSRNYEVTLNFLPNTQIVLNRDLGVSDVFSSGQNFWIEEADSGTVLSVIAEPTTAAVYIDNTRVGSAPYSSSDLTEGEYDLRVEAAGFESQTARIKIQKGFKLNVSIKLFPLPVPAKVELLDGAESLYGIITTEPQVSSNSADWVAAVLYWNKTRGINVAGAGTNKEPVFDYFLAFDGRLYDKSGNTLTDLENPELLAGAEKGAYLGRVTDGEGITEQAKVTLEAIGGALSGAQKVEILETGLGWLRVRGAPGLGGVEVTKVNVGEVYEVMEVQEGWTKIKVSDLIEGWVSSDYVKEVVNDKDEVAGAKTETPLEETSTE